MEIKKEDFSDLLKKFNRKKISKSRFRALHEFTPKGERERISCLRSLRKARKSGADSLAEFKQRKIKRGVIGVSMPSIRLEKKFLDMGQRRSMLVPLLEIEGDGLRLLMVEKTDETGRVFLTWPGGKARSAGESPLQTCIREILEETGLDFTPEIASLKHLGAISHGGEKGEVDIFFGEKKMKREGLLNLRPKPNQNIVLLTFRMLAREAEKPGRISQNAIKALEFLANS